VRFVPLHPSPDEKNHVCYENTTLFTLGNFQYTALALAYNLSDGFRKHMFTNCAFAALVIAVLRDAALFNLSLVLDNEI
jgi:cation-transporting ATPase 13A3/4/5